MLYSLSCVKPGSRKVIVGAPQKDYLMALASARRLFGSGCAGIHHCQLAAYYRALVGVSKEKIPLIVPGKPAAWYIQLVSGKNGQECEEESVLSLARTRKQHYCIFLIEGGSTFEISMQNDQVVAVESTCF